MRRRYGYRRVVLDSVYALALVAALVALAAVGGRSAYKIFRSR
jgi:hypothetical protein